MLEQRPDLSNSTSGNKILMFPSSIHLLYYFHWSDSNLFFYRTDLRCGLKSNNSMPVPNRLVTLFTTKVFTQLVCLWNAISLHIPTTKCSLSSDTLPAISDVFINVGFPILFNLSMLIIGMSLSVLFTSFTFTCRNFLHLLSLQLSTEKTWEFFMF